MNLRSAILLWLTVALASVNGTAADKTCLLLPSLVHLDAWKTGETTAGVKMESVDGTLAVECDTAKGNRVEQLLATPLEVPQWADDFTFVCSADRQPAQLMLDLILEDGAGKRWFAKVKAPGTSAYHKNLGVLNTGQLGGRPERLTVPAMAGPGVRDFRGDEAPVQAVPRPWKVLGFRWTGDRLPNHSAKPAILYLSQFAFSALRPGNSEYSGMYRDRSFYAELGELPGIPAADFYTAPGVYELGWSVFDDYAGTPVAQGTARFDLGGNSANQPLALQLARMAALPQMPQGTYWVRWRARRLVSGKTLPIAAEVLEGEQRLYVANSKVSRKAEAGEGAWLQVAPMGPRFISDAGQPFGLVIQCRRPSGTVGDGTLRVWVKTPNLRTEKKNLSVPVSWDAGDLKTIKVDLADLPAGPYTVTAELTLPEGVLDRCTILMGRQEASAFSHPAVLKQLPEGVSDWKTALNRPEPYFHLTPMIHSATAGIKEKTRWDWLSHFLDEAPAVSRDTEYHFPWKLVEPLPGVFDWEEMDLYLKKCQERNLQVVIAPEFWGYEPEWLPSAPTMNKDGRIFFDFAYNYHNVRQNYAGSPLLKEQLAKAISGIIAHVKENPVVQGYYVIQELPADAEWMNWTEGYDELTLSSYQKAMGKAFPDLKKLSQRWGRTLDSIQSICPPSADASPRERLDWLQFRADGADSGLEMLIQTVRDQDPLRLIFVYGDIFGTKLTYPKLLKMGCALANGGSHDAMHPFSISQDGLNGMVSRTEDHWPGKWTGYFPEVLDASVFAMSYGGGTAMNCHHFMFTYLPELGRDRYVSFSDLRKPPYSLDRFEKFQPIWHALRQTDRLPVEVVELLSTDAGILYNGILSRNGIWDGQAQLACYRSHVNFGANELPTAANAKLLLMIKDRLDTLPRETLEALKDYVAKGGCLFMLPRSGRKCVETPEQDWVLLREFGFQAPASNAAVKGSFVALADPDSGFGTSRLEPFSVGGQYEHSLAEEERAAACFKQAPGTAALSWKPFGQGRVAVLWSENLPPRDDEKEGLSGNVLGAAAEWAGVEPVMGASSPLFWLNLLKARSGEDYFGLAHLGQWAGRPNHGESGSVRYRLDSHATYHVTEMISGKDLGQISGNEIWLKGLQLELTPRQVAIFKFQKL